MSTPAESSSSRDIVISRQSALEVEHATTVAILKAQLDHEIAACSHLEDRSKEVRERAARDADQALAVYHLCEDELAHVGARARLSAE